MTQQLLPSKTTAAVESSNPLQCTLMSQRLHHWSLTQIPPGIMQLGSTINIATTMLYPPLAPLDNLVGCTLPELLHQTHNVLHPAPRPCCVCPRMSPALPSSRTPRRASCAPTPTTSTGTTDCCLRHGRTQHTRTPSSTTLR
jgi:hypothetical protein